MSDQIEVLIGDQEISLVVEGGALSLGMSVAQNELNQAVGEARIAANDAEAAAAVAVNATVNKADKNGGNVSGSDATDFRTNIGAVGSVNTASGTGGVARPLLGKVYEVVNADDYSSLQAAINRVADGGRVDINAGYENTLTTNVTLGQGKGLRARGNVKITLDDASILLAPNGERQAFIEGEATLGGDITGLQDGGLQIIYTGDGTAVQVGSASVNTNFFRLANFTIQTFPSDGDNAVALKILRGVGWDMDRVRIRSAYSGARMQKSLVLDGTGDYIGYGQLRNCIIGGGMYGIETISQVNHIQMYGGSLNGSVGNTNTSIGLKRGDGGSGFHLVDVEMGYWDQAVDTGICKGDEYDIRPEGNTLDWNVRAGAIANRMTLRGVEELPTVSDANGVNSTNVWGRQDQVMASEMRLRAGGFLRARDPDGSGEVKLIGLLNDLARIVQIGDPDNPVDFYQFYTTAGSLGLELSRSFANFYGKLRPGLLGGGEQGLSGINVVTGVPDNGLGANNDIVIRTDGSAAANTVLYRKESGSWVAMRTAV